MLTNSRFFTGSHRNSLGHFYKLK